MHIIIGRIEIQHSVLYFFITLFLFIFLYFFVFLYNFSLKIFINVNKMCIGLVSAD